MRILLVEDDVSLRESLKLGLEAEHFAVDTAQDGEQGSFMARTHDYDLLIVDYMLPKKNGKQLCTDVRGAGKRMPILFLSVRSEITDKVEILEVGADDYVVKPFALAEVVARIRALVRRPQEIAEDVLKFDDITLDARRHVVTRGKEPVYLTRKEFMLLEYLLRKQGSVVTRAMLIDHVWDSSIDEFSNTIESHILSLRKKIESKRKRYIQTVPGRGYKIDHQR